MVEIILLIIVIILVWKHWERVKLVSAGILFMIAFVIWGIGFYIYCFMSTIFDHIRR